MKSENLDDGEKKAFLNGLNQFLSDRGKVLFPYPRLAGIVLDLHDLYNKVTTAGGYQKVTDRELWEDFLLEYKFPIISSTLCFGLKAVYQRYLEEYEKVHYFGDDEVSKKHKFDFSIRKSRNPKFIPERDRAQYGLSLTRLSEPRFATDISDYERIAFSLTSGLPNEVDFAINACTLLSGESRHVLRLSRCPQLLEALLLHAGIVSDDVSTYSGVASNWHQRSGHDFHKFWRDTVGDKSILKEMLLEFSKEKNQPSSSGKSQSDSGANVDLCEGTSKCRSHRDWSSLFQTKRSLGVQDYEGQRILQIALVLLNLSFESFNVSLLAKSKPLIRFVFLCIYSTYSSLRQTGLDILGNLSSHMSVESLGLSIMNCTYLTAERCIKSHDKFDQLRGYEVLGNLCRSVENKNSLLISLNESIFKSSVLVLTIGDIELALAAIEALYFLSKLGEETCTKIAVVSGSIDILVCLVTFNVRTLGSSQLSAIRIARRITPPSQPQHAPQHHQQPAYNAPRPNFVHPPSIRHPLPQVQPPRIVTPHYQATIPHSAPPAPTHQPRHVVSAVQKPPNRVESSRPAGAGPMYTHSETSATPPVYHYIPAPPPDIMLDKSPESFAQLWVWATYEQCAESEGSVPRVQLFADYATAAGHYGMSSKNQVLPAADFGRCLQRVFSNTASRLFTDQNGQPMYHITGIRKRQTPLPVPGHHPQNHNQTAVSVTPNTTQATSSVTPKSVTAVPCTLPLTPVVTPATLPASTTGPPGTVPVAATVTPHIVAAISSVSPGTVPVASQPNVSTTQSTTSDAVICQNTNNPAADTTKISSSVPVPAGDTKLPDTSVTLPTPSVTGQSKLSVTNDQNSSTINGGPDRNGTISLKPNTNSNVPATPSSADNAKNCNVALVNGEVAESPLSHCNNDVVFSKLTDTDDVKFPGHCDQNCSIDKSQIAPEKTKSSLDTKKLSEGNIKTENMCNGELEEDVIDTKNLEVGHSPSSEPMLINGSLSPLGGSMPPSPSSENQHKTNGIVKTEPPVAVDKSSSDVSTKTEVSSPSKARTSAQTSPIGPSQLNKYYKVQMQQDGKTKPPAQTSVINSHTNGPACNDPATQFTPIDPNCALSTSVHGTQILQQNNIQVSVKRVLPPPSDDTPPTKQHCPSTDTLKPSHVPTSAAPFSVAPVSTSVVHRKDPIPSQTYHPPRTSTTPGNPPQASGTPHHSGNKKPPPIDLMAPNASVMVLFRNSGKQSFDDFSDEKEDPISKSLRLTSVLILTNIAKHCDYGRSMLQRHESWFSQLSMSGMDCSPNLAKLLSIIDR